MYRHTEWHHNWRQVQSHQPLSTGVERAFPICYVLAPMPPVDPTIRFSDRVEDYDRYRPRYPAALLSWLQEKGLSTRDVVADVGSGTGILTRLFLDAGCTVFAVEPNDEMRHTAEVLLGHHPRFNSVSGQAEAANLEANSVDIVVAGQAFHWFDAEAAKTEFRRILRPPARVALVWNDRQADASAFMEDYERLLDNWGRDYRDTSYRHQPLDQILAAFFDPGFVVGRFQNKQSLDEPGLVGRFFSASYTPGKNDPAYSAAREAIKEVFWKHQREGAVVLEYLTTVYLGSLSP